MTNQAQVDQTFKAPYDVALPKITAEIREEFQDEAFILNQPWGQWTQAAVDFAASVVRPAVKAEIERLQLALETYGHHTHPNCHDLTLNEDGSFGPRNGCLCGYDKAVCP